MNKYQLESSSKYAYDVSKVILAVLVVGPLVRPEEFNVAVFLSGVVASVLTFVLGYLLDGRRR